MPRQSEARAGLWNIAEVFEDEAVERFRTFERKSGTQLAIEDAKRRHAVGGHTAIRFALEYIGSAGRLRGEFADDFLENVFERHQALKLTVFVHYQAETLAVR